MSESIGELAVALVAAYGELTNPPKNGSGQVGQRQYKYADLGDVKDAIRPVFARHGLVLLQAPSSGKSGPIITTMILHRSGQWLQPDPLEMPVGKGDAQGWGSAITYGLRYAAQAVAGIVGEDDDDGAAACRPQEPGGKKKAAPPSPPKTGKVHRAAQKYEQRLVDASLCAPGELLDHLVNRLGREYPGRIEGWPDSTFDRVQSECLEYRKGCEEAIDAASPKTNAQAAR